MSEAKIKPSVPIIIISKAAVIGVSSWVFLVCLFFKLIN